MQTLLSFLLALKWKLAWYFKLIAVMNDSNGEGKAEYSDDFDSSDEDGKSEWINNWHVPYTTSALVVGKS